MVVLNRFEWNNIHPVLVFSFKTNVSMTEEKHWRSWRRKWSGNEWAGLASFTSWRTQNVVSRYSRRGKTDESDLTAVTSMRRMSGVCEHSCACIQHSFGRKVDFRGNCFTITPINVIIQSIIRRHYHLISWIVCWLGRQLTVWPKQPTCMFAAARITYHYLDPIPASKIWPQSFQHQACRACERF